MEPLIQIKRGTEMTETSRDAVGLGLIITILACLAILAITYV
jgi:hypothetical protein